MKKKEFLKKGRGLTAMLLTLCMVVTPLAAFADSVPSGDQTGTEASQTETDETEAKKTQTDETEAKKTPEETSEKVDTSLAEDNSPAETSTPKETSSPAENVSSGKIQVDGGKIDESEPAAVQTQPAAISIDMDDDGTVKLLEGGSTTWDGTAIDTTWYTEHTDDTEYTITTAAQLAGLASLVNSADKVTFSGKTIKLGTDLDMNNQEWTPIGNNTTSYGADLTFKGTFDGQGHTISNVKISDVETLSNAVFNRGFFGRTDDAVLKDFTLVVDFTYAKNNAGGVVATAKNTTFDGITVQGSLQISSKATAANQVGGIVGNTDTSVTIINCKNEANINGNASAENSSTDNYVKSTYVGGIVGKAVKATISDCENTGRVVGGYAVGGIVGQTYTNSSTIKRCINNGTIDANWVKSPGLSYAAGGIVGYLNKADVVDSCINHGKITVNTSAAGGIVGVYNIAKAYITNCYNTGAVENIYSTGVAGGIVGYAGTSTWSQTDAYIENCYNAGQITGSDGKTGGILAAYAKSGATVKTDYISNNYYFSDMASVGIGSVTVIPEKTAMAFTYDASTGYTALIDGLGGSYKADITPAVNSGRPILRWQDPNSSYVAALKLVRDKDDNAGGTVSVVVKSEDGNVQTRTEGTDADTYSYELKNGNYTYEVSVQGYTGADGSEKTTGSFTIDKSSKEIKIPLKAVKYTWTFTITTADADMVLKDASGKEVTPVSDAAAASTGAAVNTTVYKYELYNGTYTYSASKFGYVEGEVDTSAVEGSVTVSFANGTQTVPLTQTQALAKLTFNVLYADGKSDVVPEISITSEDGDYKDTVIYEGSKVDGVVFPEGKYSYTVRASGYTKVAGEFTLTDAYNATPLVIDVTLPVSTAWDGTSVDTSWYTKDTSADTFYIYTAADLAGLAQIVNYGTDIFKGKTIELMSNIDLGEATWKPIGVFIAGSDTKYFAGHFDGNGHTVTINEGRFAPGEMGFGLFGAVKGKSVTDRASVKNLTFYGKVKAESTVSPSYVGAVAGYATYADFECIANSMDIDLTAKISGRSAAIDLGGLVGLSVYNNFNKCSNQGNISGAIDSTASTRICYVGGICGMATQSNKNNTYEITDCYNNGAISSSGGTITYSGGIVGSTSTNSFASMANCYSSGSVTSGQPLVGGSGKYTGEGTGNNYYLDTTLGQGLTSNMGESKTSEELKALAPTLGDSYKSGTLYPVLTWQAAPVKVEVKTSPSKVAYNDFESFDDAGLELTAYYSDTDAENKTNGSTIVSGWQVKDGDCLSATQTYVTISYMGAECQVPITVTQVVHYIYTDDLTFDVAAPVVGASPQSTITLSDEQKEKIASATIKWYADGKAMKSTDTFAKGVYYRAKVTVDTVYTDGVVWYKFDSTAKPEVDGVYELLYRTLGNSAKRLTFTLTWGVSDTVSDKASHRYYAGDDRIAADYAQYLEDTITVQAGDTKKVYTVADIEKKALSDGIEKTYSYQGLNSRSNYLMTGLPVYALIRDAYPDIVKASDESVITIGTKDFTLGELRSIGYSYDAKGEVIEKNLPYLLAYGVDGTPYTGEKGPLYLAAPAPGKDNDTTANFVANVSDIIINVVTAEQYNVTFLAADKEGNDISAATVKITDKYGNVVYNGAPGTVALNVGETYNYEVTADGYGVKTGTVSEATTIKAELLLVWSGQYTEPATDESGAYLIYNADELMWYNQQATTVSNKRSMEMMACDIKLMADIDMSGTEGKWLPMGALNGNNTLYFYVVNPDLPKYYGGGAYSGTFDGNGHVIRNLNVDWENYYVLEEAWDGSPLAYSYRLDYMGGLFGMAKGATIKNVGIEGSISVLDRPASTLADWYQFGGIVGFVGSASTITGCYADIDMDYKTDTSSETLDGYAYAGYSDKCDLYIGGLVGSLEYSSEGTMSVIENSYSKGTLHSGGTRTVRAGGIVGATRNCKNKITKCWSSMALAISPSQTGETETFPTYAGGIIGGVNCVPLSSGNDETEISYCFALNPSITIELDAEFAHANRVIGDEDFAANGGIAKYNFGLEKMAINGAAFTTPDSEQNYRSAVGRTIVPERALNGKSYTNVYWNSESDGTIWSFDGDYPTLSWQKKDTAEPDDPSEDPDDKKDDGKKDDGKKDDGTDTGKDNTGDIDDDDDDDDDDSYSTDHSSGGSSSSGSSSSGGSGSSSSGSGSSSSSGSGSGSSSTTTNGNAANGNATNGNATNGNAANGTTTDNTAGNISGDTTAASGEVTESGKYVSEKYSDIDTKDWYCNSVGYVVEKGLFEGVSEKSFAPKSNMTRAMFATVLMRYEKSEGNSVDGYTSKFSDIAGDSWYNQSVSWASSIGVVNGTGSGEFAPNENITREQLALMMYRYAEHLNLDTSTKETAHIFADSADISSYATDALAWAYEKGIMTGKSNNCLDPKGYASRAEVAVVVLRFANLA